MPDNGALTRKDLEECLAVVATKDDLKRFATKRDFERLAGRMANLVVDMEDIKERVPPKSYFLKMMDLMDGMANAFEDQGRRLWGQADLWEKLHDKVHKDHEPRISRLESQG
ncbi:MAG: hypothetical protein HY748_02740 [Elusimicrobia bacterium]|nr:hypothetical protein [Elusimicrobiota bacterium]